MESRHNSGRWQHTDGILQERELVLDNFMLSGDGLQIQIASDLHIEFYGNVTTEELDQLIIPNAPVLALLGDIGIPTHPSYCDFLLMQAQRFQAVLVLSGNHEYYNVQDPQDVPPPPMAGSEQPFLSMPTQSSPKVCYSVDDMEAAIEMICAKSPRLHYVDNTCVRFGSGATSPALLCTPLWSHVPEEAMDEVGGSMNDYFKSYVRCEEQDTMFKDCEGRALVSLNPEITSRWHAMAVSWLERSIERLHGSGCKCIGLVSHHAPTMRGASHPRHEHTGSLVKHAFATELYAIYQDQPSIVFWAYGHTHFNNDRRDHGIRLVCNQRGYRESIAPNYNPSFTLDLNPARRASLRTPSSAAQLFEEQADSMV